MAADGGEAPICKKCDDDTEAVAVWHRRDADVQVCDRHAKVALGWDHNADVEELEEVDR